MFERYLLGWLIALSALACWWPAPFVATAAGLPYVFAVAMFAIGGLIPRSELRYILRRWPVVVGGTMLQYTVMPILAWLAATAWGLSGPERIGLILVGCVPGAMASNVLTLAARGNVSYSVALTTSATLLSPLVVPIWLWLLLRTQISIDPVGVCIQLLLTVVLPVLAGHELAFRAARIEHLFRRGAGPIANLAILWIIATVVAQNRDVMAQTLGWMVLPLLFVNLAGYLAGYSGGKLLGLDEPMRRALTIEIGMQNAGLGAVLAARIDPMAAVAPAAYTFGCMLTGTILARFWASNGARLALAATADTDDPLCAPSDGPPR